MISLNKFKLAVLCVFIATLLTGCGSNKDDLATGSDVASKPNNTLETNTSQNNTPQNNTPQNNTPPDKTNAFDIAGKAPNDIPILESAKDLKKTKVGEGVVRGDLYYEISFRLEYAIEPIVEQYRKIFDDLGLDYADQLEKEIYSVTGSTGPWEFIMTITLSNEHKGESVVKIVYLKL